MVAPLLARVAADGHPLCTDVRRGTGDDGEEPGTAAQTAERQRTGEGAEDRRGAERTVVRRRLRRGWPQLALPMVRAAQLGRVGGRRTLPGLLPPLCRGAAREHLPLAHHRGAGTPKGDRHRPLWHRASPHVYVHHHPLPHDAPSAGLAHLFCHHAALYPPHRQAHPQRRNRAGARA